MGLFLKHLLEEDNLLVKTLYIYESSGNAVRYWMQKKKIPLENVLIIVDDIALSFGSLRLKGKGVMLVIMD